MLKSNGGISELTLASSSRPLMLNTIGASMQNNAEKTNKGKIKLKVWLTPKIWSWAAPHSQLFLISCKNDYNTAQHTPQLCEAVFLQASSNASKFHNFNQKWSLLLELKLTTFVRRRHSKMFAKDSNEYKVNNAQCRILQDKKLQYFLADRSWPFLTLQIS